MSPSAREQHSAGIVVFREAADSSGNPPDRQFLLLDYGRHWDFAKGHLEPGEDHRAAAMRELREETGITDAEIVPGFQRQITYYFRDHKKGLVRKTVTYFLGRTRAEKIALSEEHVGGEFLPLRQAINRLTFASSKQVLHEAVEFLDASFREPKI
ncbi:MAG TPA: NUDIX domain-containing protein [Tepidisphaeraceae bacterium]|jgi:8-oxo-dGTP pyrophosphatase MutT (NUDIX family)|nr:NUDIX domain-containing protein [Tepidisphaeraceae bacterium]